MGTPTSSVRKLAGKGRRGGENKYSRKYRVIEKMWAPGL
jgi:hypothetical protein